MTKTAFGQACPIPKNQGIPTSRPVFPQEELLSSAQELQTKATFKKMKRGKENGKKIRYGKEGK